MTVDTMVVDALGRMGDSLDIILLPNRTRTGGPPEPILQGRWVEVLRHSLDALEPSRRALEIAEEREVPRSQAANPETIAAVYERLLPTGAEPDAARAWAVFLLDTLAGIPSCPPEVTAQALDLALASCRLGDAVSSRGSLLDAAIDDLVRSGRLQLVRERTARARAESDRSRSPVLDRYLVNAARVPEGAVVDGRLTLIGRQWLDDRVASVQHGDDETALPAAADLIEAFYQWHRGKWPSPPGTADLDVVDAARFDQTMEALLSVAERQCPASELAAWALVWLTLARSAAGDGRSLTSERRARIRTMVGNTGYTLVGRAHLALLLAIDPAIPVLVGREDWIYSWAVVADGGGPPKQPPAASATADDPDVRVVQSLVSDVAATLDGPKGERQGLIAGLALARLDADGSDLRRVLLALFQDPITDESLRDEALVYLTRGPGSVEEEARECLVELARSRGTDGAEDSFEQVRGLLSLVGIGDVRGIRAAIGSTAPVPGYERSYVYSLARSPDAEAREALEDLLDHPDDRVRAHARKAIGPERIDAEIATQEQLLSDRTRLLGADALETLEVRRDLAHWLAEAGRDSEAVASLMTLRNDCARLLGPDHDLTSDVRARLERLGGPVS